MATVDDPDILMENQDEEMDEELDEEHGSVGSQSWVMEVEEEPKPVRFVPREIPVDKSYGKPRLDALPTVVLLKIVARIGLGETVALRRTCRALNRFVSDTHEVWVTRVKQLRRKKKLLMGGVPVVLPRLLEPAYPEELLRCAFLLQYNWDHPAYHLQPISTLGPSWSTQGVEQILFVPDSMGRYFLTVSRGDVHLWTLRPHSFPRICRKLFPWATASLHDRERIINVLVSRPSGDHSRNVVAYMAIQFSVKDSRRLRTEIHQIHLTEPGLVPDQQGFGLCCVHMTEGALVAFTDFVLAYALGDAAQTILLCCWVTRQATRLVTPVPEWEIRWQHHSCRAVVIGEEIIVVVRDSTAEVYPREAFTLLDDDQWPYFLNQTIIEGELEYLPTTYATDIATFPCSFTGPTKIHIHRPRAAMSRSEGWNVDLCVQPISVIGVARPLMPPTDPGVPYYVTTARLFRTPTPQSSGMATPSVSNPPSPSHTGPSLPSHTVPYIRMPSPLPAPERYKFVFHVHALQSQSYFSYGPILAGPNGRGVVLGTRMGVGGGPRQFVAKFRHPSDEELRKMVWPDASLRFVPQITRHPQTNAHLPPQPYPQPPPQPVPMPIPPQMIPPIHPPMHAPHPPMPMHPPPPPEPDPFAPLLALMRPVGQLDVMHKLSYLWATNISFGYDLLAWDESAGSLVLGTKRGELAILECAFRGPPPRVPAGRALA
ncbi:hypothetical protein FS749_003144 [Ceratobasidium sp. UAMH 11750]|nr:hypothetical protein FS749_003144 [Ceratobasidium sp. UAMH 11750]